MSEWGRAGEETEERDRGVEGGRERKQHSIAKKARIYKRQKNDRHKSETCSEK